mmetsp:Transcript_55080/g.101973  ORF Transcript_55080/g.101973 Transcript_55080/m.101973 type:complete len:201 (-) Transcript_55080:170-772(-)
MKLLIIFVFATRSRSPPSIWTAVVFNTLHRFCTSSLDDTLKLLELLLPDPSESKACLRLDLLRTSALWCRKRSYSSKSSLSTVIIDLASLNCRDFSRRRVKVLGRSCPGAPPPFLLPLEAAVGLVGFEGCCDRLPGRDPSEAGRMSLTSACPPPNPAVFESMPALSISSTCKVVSHSGLRLPAPPPALLMLVASRTTSVP